MCVGVGDNKVIRCCSSVCCWCCSGRLVGMVVLVLVLVKVDGGEVGNERTHSHALPKAKLPISDSILTDLHTLTIHITVYLIPVFLTI